MADIVYDFGNARVKWFVPRASRFEDFRHAIAELKEPEWQKVVGRKSKPPAGFARVNGTPFAFGDAARRYIISERPAGAARYKRTYYGPPLAYVLSEAFAKNVGKVIVVASHAPGDIGYARNLIESAKGEWYVESRHGELYFNVVDVLTFDEPVGGYSHFTLTEKGQEQKKNPFKDIMVLVVDVGGHTVDVMAIDPGAEIDLLSLKSTRTGITQMTEEFESALRANNRTMFQDAGDLDIRRVENAILTGAYQFGKVSVNCRDEVNAALNTLMNDVIQVIEKAGGAANFDYILLTGGGAVLLRNSLVQAYPRIDFIMADGNPDLMKFANVFGGAKILAMLQTLGEW